MNPPCPICETPMLTTSSGRFTCAKYKCPLGVVDITIEAIDALLDKIQQLEAEIDMERGI